jgi:hypothetical protein
MDFVHAVVAAANSLDVDVVLSHLIHLFSPVDEEL